LASVISRRLSPRRGKLKEEEGKEREDLRTEYLERRNVHSHTLASENSLWRVREERRAKQGGGGNVKKEIRAEGPHLDKRGGDPDIEIKRPQLGNKGID